MASSARISAYLLSLLLWMPSASSLADTKVSQPREAVQTAPTPVSADSAVPTGNLQDDEPPPRGFLRTGKPHTESSNPSEENPSDAFGSIDEMVRQHVQAARTHFASGHYDQAIIELESAYKLRPNANYLFSIAQSHRRAGRNRKALSEYQRFLSADPNSSLRNETQNYIGELRTLIQQEDAIERERKRPIWKKGWFWGVVASSTAVVGVSLGVGLGVGLKDSTQTINLSFGQGNALTLSQGASQMRP